VDAKPEACPMIADPPKTCTKYAKKMRAYVILIFFVDINGGMIDALTTNH
jgi:hypothetical protein